MLTKEFISRLEEKLKVKLELRQSPNYPSMSGVYYDGVYICAAPSEQIKAEHDTSYTNESGYPHRTSVFVEAKVVDFVNRYNSDPEFKALVNEKIS